VSARTKKGDAYMKQGYKAEIRKEFEQALAQYELAVNEDPADAGYQIAAKRVRFQAGQMRVDLGLHLRAQGKLVEALAEFQKAYAIDPASAIAEQEIKRTREMIDRQSQQPTNSSDKGLTPGEAAEQEAEDRVARMQAIPDLKPITRQISTLKMNNQPVRVLYETVGKLAGINVVMDPEFTPGAKPNYTVDLSNTTLEEALDNLGVITKTFWKPLSANTIFITNDNVTKRRDYEDYVVKVFYIRNATTVQELQEIATTVRSIAEIRRAFTYNGLNAIMVRDTADKVALAEKLIQDLDKPKAEVVIDVVVMQANRNKIRDLAATLTTSGAPGINIPITYNGGASSGDGTTTSNLLPLNQFKNLTSGNFSAPVPGALLQAVMSDSSTRVLQKPQLRAVENQKASLKIGDKVPYASGSFTPVTGTGSGFTPYAQTQFQFADVGVNVDLTPKVHGRDEISMDVEVEISNVSGQVTIAGVQQPIISQRKVHHAIRIREGEVNLLGGLMSTQDIKNLSGIPGLMNVPFFRYFFSTEHTEHQEIELLIALIPHIVRAPEFNEVNLRGVSAGSDAVVKLSYAPVQGRSGEPGPALTQPPAGQQQPAGPATPAPAPPAPAQPAPGQPALGQQPATPAPPAAATPPPPAAPANEPQLSFVMPAQTVPVNAPFTVTLQLINAHDFFSASPIKVKFDPKVVQLTSVKQGAFAGSDGQKVNFTENTLNDTGDAIVTLNRIPGSGGVSGGGPLLTLTFQPVAKGTAEISLSEITVRNTQLDALKLQLPKTTVKVE
jgi:general secretion pathway protein D